ncbi:hypothetical protein CEUSTIGMA_g4128.t1 [Chlamydomonas eustigma]|uniref:Uncharacterized protein n=1 Tax=Chlamydomonas eustigma TaxID=1157962 RepID=A0A250X1C0_9CHLO|nr:hypothetical protein CEUSTIGMA_g4128.t1 [Chlamydomonas eustigma]|eukprot:GAX76682.1 hypothetical protein CEUSTIGMA_g4128.t1 [Chlamydomonas eustigma]
MVYQEMNQLKRYHYLPDSFLTTKEHFHDDPVKREIPNGGPHKRSTHGKLYNGSSFYTSKSLRPTIRSASASTVHLSNDFSTKTLPSSTYSGNGNFVVELPHSTISYKRTWSTQNNSFVSEYGDKYLGQKSVLGGYSVLSTRR